MLKKYGPSVPDETLQKLVGAFSELRQVCSLSQIFSSKYQKGWAASAYIKGKTLIFNYVFSQIRKCELILWANLSFETSWLTTTKSSTLTPPEKLWMLSNTWRSFRTTVCQGSLGTCSTSTPTQKRLGKPSMPYYRSTVCDQKLPKELPTWTDLSAGVDNVTETDNTICDLLQKYWKELCF